MADRLAGARARLEKVKSWKVVGGASTGGLIVKESSKLSSNELSERLGTGALVLETELVGERLKYKLVNGTGPASGWVSTKVKGHALLVKHTLRIAIMCAGSRGDMQPLLALGLGLKRTGFRVTLWTHENFCELVESSGLPCFGFLDAFGPSHSRQERKHQVKQSEEGNQPAAAEAVRPPSIAPARLPDEQEQPPSLGSLPLALAVDSGNLSETLRLLKARTDPNVQDPIGETPIFKAAECRRTDIVAALLLHSADPNWENKSLAVAMDYADPVTESLLMLFQGADVPSEAAEAALKATGALRAAVTARLAGKSSAARAQPPHQAGPPLRAASSTAETDEKREAEVVKAKEMREQTKEEEEELEKERARLYCTFWARYALSACYDIRVAGVSWKDPLPELDGARNRPESAHVMLNIKGVVSGMGRFPHVAGEIGKAAEKLLVANRSPDRASQGSTADAEAATDAEPSHREAPKDPKDQWEEDVKRYRNFNLSGVHEIAGLGKFGRDDPTRPQRFLEAYEEEGPDLVLWHWGFLPALAMNLELKFGTPGMPFGLHPPVDPADPTAPWMTPERWYTQVFSLRPDLQQLGSFEEARARWPVLSVTKEESTIEPGAYGFWLQVEEALLEPVFGCAAVRCMGPELYHKRSNQGLLKGYLSSLASERVLSQLGAGAKMQVSTHTITGFWMMDEQDQTSTEMFGDAATLGQVKDFLAAGPKPAYIGWGSMEAWKGPEWMCVLAVAALKEAGMRGIILSGWAGLDTKILQETLGGEDELGLCAYARRNVLFVQRISRTWLFPQCQVIVIHGGSGTTADAWSSGVPTVIVPAFHDQPQNGLLNEFVGAGCCTRNLHDISPAELAGALKWAATSKDALRGAQGVQFSMMRDRPIEKATERILEFLAEDGHPIWQVEVHQGRKGAQGEDGGGVV